VDVLVVHLVDSLVAHLVDFLVGLVVRSSALCQLVVVVGASFVRQLVEVVEASFVCHLVEVVLVRFVCQLVEAVEEVDLILDFVSVTYQVDSVIGIVLQLDADLIVIGIDLSHLHHLDFELDLFDALPYLKI
jgi:hypothetical protein